MSPADSSAEGASDDKDALQRRVDHALRRMHAEAHGHTAIGPPIVKALNPPTDDAARHVYLAGAAAALQILDAARDDDSFELLSDPKRHALVEANAYLGLHSRTGNGAFLWMAYLELRAVDAPLPAYLLSRVDQMAQALLSVDQSSDRARLAGIAEAVGMKMPGRAGGPQGMARARRTLATRVIVAAVHERIGLGSPRIADAEVFRRVAQRFRKTPRQVEEMYRAWMSDHSKGR